MKSLDSLASKRIIGILIKAKYGFFTPLTDLHKPSDAALIGIFPKTFKQKVSQKFKSHFDVIFWFHIDDNLMRCLTDSKYRNKLESIPAVEKIIFNLIKVLPSEKLQIIVLEEFLIQFSCNLREKFNLPGPKSHDLAYLRDKSILKVVAKERKILTMNFCIFDPSKIYSIDDEIERITKAIGKFPYFRKPLSNSGSTGAEKINDTKELKEFIEENSKENEGSIYLIEECINGKDITEFWCWCILSENGGCQIISCIGGKQGLTHAMHLKTGEPFPFRAFSPEHRKIIFPKIEEFVFDVIEKLQPPIPSAFGVQGFQLQPKTSKYILTEVACRIGGGRDTPATFYGTGISQEEAALSCYLDPNYTIKPKNYSIKHHVALWYPSIKGTIKSLNEIDENDAIITSKLEYTWFAAAGKRMEIANSTDDYILCLNITNEISENEFLKDVEWITKNYRPFNIV